MKKNKRHVGLIIFLSVAALLALTFGIYSYFGGFGTGDCADVEEFSKYALGVEDITFPENAQIIALGEATHGNAQFQRLKLDVFRQAVEKRGVGAFALEGDFGGCEAVDRYIHGGEGTAAEAAAAIGFTIYRTDEMAELIEWMRRYNDTAPEGEDLRFYGFDMQRYALSYHYLLEAAESHGIDTAELKGIWDEEADAYSDSFTGEQREEILTKVKNALPATDGKAIHYIDCLLQNTRLGKTTTDGGQLNALRDVLMAENTMWVLEQERQRGKDCIFISGHNGHVEQEGSYGPEDKVMGNLLADQLGDGYFVIGTDFFKTRCNLPKGSDGTRQSHTFFSYDPLAKASKKCGFEESYLDFSTVPAASSLRSLIDGYMWIGSVGEGYSPIIMSLLPMSYRVWRSPAVMYDGMIFVSNANPTDIRPAP